MRNATNNDFNQRDESFTVNNNYYGNQNFNPHQAVTARIRNNNNNLHSEYDIISEKKSILSSGRIFNYNNNNNYTPNPHLSNLSNLNQYSPSHVDHQNNNLIQRKNSLGINNQKVFSKRYTDVHANSKLHYNNNLDEEDKTFIEPSQWNDRTNRYFYLKEQNSQNQSNISNLKNPYNVNTNNLWSGHSNVNLDYASKVAELNNFKSPSNQYVNKNFSMNNYSANSAVTAGLQKNNYSSNSYISNISNNKI